MSAGTVADMRVLDTVAMSARRNIALTAALAALHRAGQTPDTLRFCRYPRAVLLGHDDSFAGVYRVKACVPGRIEIARRAIGDGTVYVGPGVLVWSIVAERYRFGAHLSEIAERICSAVAAGLARSGLAARFRPRGDVEIDGRTVCRASGAIDGATVVFEGTLLVDLDPRERDAVARLAGPLHDDVNPPDAAARVTTVSAWLGRVPADGEIEGLLLAGLAHGWRCALAPGTLTPAEAQFADRLFADGVGRPMHPRAAPRTRRAARAMAERARVP